MNIWITKTPAQINEASDHTLLKKNLRAVDLASLGIGSVGGTSVQALPLNPPSGGSVDYTIDLRHLGSFSNTFALTVNIPPAHAFMVSAQAQQGVLNQSVYQLLWSGTVTGVETWTATYRLQIGTVPATAYLLTHSLRLTARNAATVILTPTVMVNGTLTYLPMIMREN